MYNKITKCSHTFKSSSYIHVRMNRILFALLVALLPVCAHAKFRKIDLSEGVMNKAITLKASNTNGHYRGKTTELRIINNTDEPMGVRVDTAAILRPDDTANQPMVLAGGEYVIIQPNKEQVVQVLTFCGNAPKHCPSVGSAYSFWKVGSDTLRKVLTFASRNGVDIDVTQAAVWVITNNEPVSTVYVDDRPDLNKKLMALLCQLTGQKEPDYYTIVKRTETPGEAAFQPKALKIIAEFTALLDSPKTMTLGVFNDKGEMIQKVFQDQDFRRAGHIFKVEFESANVPVGKYYIRLKERELVMQEKMVEVK